MISQNLLRRVVPAALTVALLAVTGCGKPRGEGKPAADPPSGRNASDMAPRARPALRPGVRPAVTVAAAPPGAPTTGDLLAYAQDPPAFFDWRKTPVWSDLVATHFRLPSGTTRDTARILKKGWGGAGATRLREHLHAQARSVDRATVLPPCAPLRRTWTQTELLLEHRSLFSLKMLQEALLLRARLHQSQGRPGQALDAAVAALRFACHMAHVPEVIMQLMALRAEQKALVVLGDLKTDRAGCERTQRALTFHASRRAPLTHMARADWLMARSHLRMITKELTKAPRADARAMKRLRRLRRLILERTSARYRRYSRLVRQGLATGRTADWKGLDRLLATHRAALSQLKKNHGVSSHSEVNKIVANLPGKAPAWTADVISKVFLGLVTMRSSPWKRARQLHLKNGQSIARLRARSCSIRPRPSAAP